MFVTNEGKFDKTCCIQVYSKDNMLKMDTSKKWQVIGVHINSTKSNSEAKADIKPWWWTTLWPWPFQLLARMSILLQIWASTLWNVKALSLAHYPDFILLVGGSIGQVANVTDWWTTDSHFFVRCVPHTIHWSTQGALEW